MQPICRIPRLAIDEPLVSNDLKIARTMKNRIFFPFVAAFLYFFLSTNTPLLAQSYANDAGISAILRPSDHFCAGIDSVEVTLKNYGTDTLRSVNIGFSAKGYSLGSYGWYGKLPPDSTVNLIPFIFNFTPPGVYTVLVSTYSPNGVTDSNYLNDEAVAYDTVYQIPAANVGANNRIACLGSLVTLGGSPVSGNTYSWTSSPQGFTSTLANPTVKALDSTVYTLVDVGPHGCTMSRYATIKVASYPVADAGTSETVCAGTSVSIGLSPTTGNTYSWASSPTGFTSTKANPKPAPTVTTNYVLIETNAAGCSDTDSVTIHVNSLPVANTGNSQTVCLGTSVTIGASKVNGSKYHWTSSPSGFTCISSDTIIIPAKSAEYILTETNLSGCSRTDSVDVTVNPLPAANAGSNHSLCAGSSVSLGSSAISGSTYIWASSPPGFTSTIAGPKVSPKASTTYYLTETNSNGCNKTDSVVIIVNPLPDAHWTMNYLGNEAYFHAIDSSLSDPSYIWTFGDGNSGSGHSIKHLYAKSKNYNTSLIVSNTHGCLNEFDSTLSILLSDIVPDTNPEFMLSVFPNPFSSYTTVQYTLNKPSKISIALFDVTGRQIATVANTILDIGSYQTEFNSEKYNLNPGVYFLKIMTDDGYISRRVVKL